MRRVISFEGRTLVPGMIEAAVEFADGGGKPRNANGEFESNDGGVVDSHTMTRAYGPPPSATNRMLPGMAASAGGITAAALLARKLKRRK
ncbi:MAG: hypothetical protein QOE70_4671 [Chthoniobacter sp.]|jgi:dihydroorotase-like cyclic amidohydrolase|nr:hypothetical protein [Chthoniobacter sp.]